MSDLIDISTLECTCSVCPSQWEGKSEESRPIYIRYRYGWLSVEFSDTEEVLLEKRCGSPGDGCMSLDELTQHLRTAGLCRPAVFQLAGLKAFNQPNY